MALDLDAIRKRLSGLQNQTGRQNHLWKPEPGKQTVRIVPYQYDKDNPFLELYFHYGFNGKNFLYNGLLRLFFVKFINIFGND